MPRAISYLWPFKPAPAILRFLVHAEALALSPAVYFQCVWWRVIGKRLRARLALAPLLGQTSYAYDLWIAQEAIEASPKLMPSDVKIVALVQKGEGIGATLSSLAAAGIEARIIDSAPQETLASLAESCPQAWIMPVISGDKVSINAGAIYGSAAAKAERGTPLIYADDDIQDKKARRCSPHFKPDWNRELFEHFDYVAGSAIVRLDHIAGHEVKTTEWPQSMICEVAKRAAKSGGEILHISKILHHRRTRPEPVLPLRPQDMSENLPSVSVIIPTRNRHDLLSNCLEGLSRTQYPRPIEIIVIDNGSDDHATREYLQSLDPKFASIIHDDGPFNFAALNNRAVQQTTGHLLCFLNNDIEIIEEHWLETMATQAVREEIGAVGAQLLYPDGRIQHAGVVTGIGGAAAHAHRLLRPDEDGYFQRHRLPQFVSAVTAACMVVSRKKFEAVGGFDAERFAVSFNDVDLCLKLREQGWENLYEPRAQLTHHESVSRGLDKDQAGAARQAKEVAALQDRWGTGLDFEPSSSHGRAPDPYHHKQLSRVSEQFVIDL